MRCERQEFNHFWLEQRKDKAVLVHAHLASQDPLACAGRRGENHHPGHDVVAGVSLESRIRVSADRADEHPMAAQLLTGHGRVILESNLNFGRTQLNGVVQPGIFLDGRFEKWEGIKEDLSVVC